MPQRQPGETGWISATRCLVPCSSESAPEDDSSSLDRRQWPVVADSCLPTECWWTSGRVLMMMVKVISMLSADESESVSEMADVKWPFGRDLGEIWENIGTGCCYGFSERYETGNLRKFSRPSATIHYRHVGKRIRFGDIPKIRYLIRNPVYWIVKKLAESKSMHHMRTFTRMAMSKTVLRV